MLRVLPIDEAICANDEYHSENYFDEVMIKRELRVLQMVKKHMKLKTHRIMCKILCGLILRNRGNWEFKSGAADERKI